MEQTLPTYNDLYNFLKKWYKHERFEARNEGDYKDYSHIVTRGRMQRLEQFGTDLISRHESVTGSAIRYNCNLEIIESSKY